jgi:transcription elongation factor Elf1
MKKINNCPECGGRLHSTSFVVLVGNNRSKILERQCGRCGLRVEQ